MKNHEELLKWLGESLQHAPGIKIWWDEDLEVFNLDTDGCYPIQVQDADFMALLRKAVAEFERPERLED